MTNIINSESLVLGLMSGTSLDGLDISYARYYKELDVWRFELITSHTYYYNDELKLKFSQVYENKISIQQFDQYFTNIIIAYVKLFIEDNNIKVDLISSHGHTIFHKPEIGYTKQVGIGKLISQKLSIPVVSNFREQDVSLGGQGAPLVPIGDKLLFSQYDSCLNLGGIANISYDVADCRVAFDICPCNMVLNHLSNRKGFSYDAFGEMAQVGNVNSNLLTQFNELPYYKKNNPKSLGKEHVDKMFMPLLYGVHISNNDLLSTFVEHIALQISFSLNQAQCINCLVTGGGAFNTYLISRINYYSSAKIIIPNHNIVNFKESIVFGFLGLLRFLNHNNCLASVTGASNDHCSGDLYNS